MCMRTMLRIVAVGIAVAAACAFEAEAKDNLPVEIVPQVSYSQAEHPVALSPDGRFAAIASFDVFRLWDVASGKALRTFVGHKQPISALAFSPDGRSIISGSMSTPSFTSTPPDTGELKLWDAITGNEVRDYGRVYSVGSVEVSPDGRTILCNCGLWDLASGKKLREISTYGALTFSPDGRFLISSTSANTLTLWDAPTGAELRKFKGSHTSYVGTSAFSPDGRFVLSGASDNTIKLWDVATGSELRTFMGHTKEITTLAFLPDGRSAISASADETIRQWDLSTGKEVNNFKGRTGPRGAVVFSMDGRFALSGAKLLDSRSGKLVRELKGHTDVASSAGISPDGRLAVTCAENGFKVWDLRGGALLRTSGAYKEAVSSCVLSPDGRFLLAASGTSLVLWEVRTGKEVRRFAGHKAPIKSIAFSQDGKFAASGSSFGAVPIELKLWDVANGKEQKNLAKVPGFPVALAFSPDNRFIFSAVVGVGAWNNLAQWDIASGQAIHTSTINTVGVSATVAFSPDGRFVASASVLAASKDDGINLHEAATGKFVRTFHGQEGGVYAIAFSRDGRFLASGGDSGRNQNLGNRYGQRNTTISRAAPSYPICGLFPRRASATLQQPRWNRQNLGHCQNARTCAHGQRPQRRMADHHARGLFLPPRIATRTCLRLCAGWRSRPSGRCTNRSSTPISCARRWRAIPMARSSAPPRLSTLKRFSTPGLRPPLRSPRTQPAAAPDTDLVTVAARITDRGKGIGRIEWRVNGVTAGVMAAPAGPGPDYEVKQELALDPGENRIEVIAYEGRNLLASLPARTTIAYDGPADTREAEAAHPRHRHQRLRGRWLGAARQLRKAGIPAAQLRPCRTPRLSAPKWKRPARGNMREVRVTAGAGCGRHARPNWTRLVTKLAGEISPRDTFVLYAAAHGYSVGGNYYMIPQDYQGGPNPEALKARAIGQERLQDWIANRIKAKKALILLDTCEFGALTGGYTKSRTEGPVSEAAVGRLHEATGRPVLTAASAGKSAYEGIRATACSPTR